MQCSMTFQKSVLVLALWITSIVAEKNIILRTLTETSGSLQRNARDVTGPSIPITTKPPCPSYINCPYPPYPRPTTKPPLTNENIPSQTTTSTTEKNIVEYFGPDSAVSSERPFSTTATDSKTDKPISENNTGNTNGPSISATSKPPCPSYINCPYPPYPRPTTKKPTQEENDSTSTPTPTASTPESLIAEYFGPEQESSSQKPSTSIELSSKPEPVHVNKPGNAQGPSVSVTSKPPCPSYITCPYPPYPRPTTKKPEEDSSTSSSTNSLPEKGIVEYFGPEEVITAINPSPSSPSTLNPVEPGKDNQPEKETTSENPSSSSESSSTLEEQVTLNHAGNAQGPSISATSKPPCPSYITCPYPSYPRPTTKRPSYQDSLSSVQTANLIAQYFGAESNTSPEDLQSVSESNSSPSIVAQDTNTAIPVTHENNAIAPVTQNDENGDERKTAIPQTLSTELPEGSSSIINSGHPLPVLELNNKSPTINNPGDWHFPDLSNADPVIGTSLSADRSETPAAELTQYIQDAIHISSGPSISATQKPLCSFYAPCPYQYPKPTTASPLGERFSENTQDYHQTTNSEPVKSNVIVSTGTSNSHGVLSPENNPLLHRNPLVVNPSLMNSGVKNPQYSTISDPIALGNQGAFLPFFSYMYGLDPYWQNTYYYNSRPSILLTPRPVWPSYLKNPWIYPQPFGSHNVYDQDSPIGSDEMNDNISSEAEDVNESNSDIESY